MKPKGLFKRWPTRGEWERRWGTIKTKYNNVKMPEGNPLHCILKTGCFKMHVEYYTLSGQNLVQASPYYKIIRDLVVPLFRWGNWRSESEPQSPWTVGLRSLHSECLTSHVLQEQEKLNLSARCLNLSKKPRNSKPGSHGFQIPLVLC